MEVQVKKTIKVISKKFHIPYEDLKSVAKKYLSGAKEYDSGLLNTIEELLDLVDISEIEEIDSFSIATLQLFARVRDIEYSSERDLKKNVKEYFETLFEEESEEETESEDSDETESDSEEEAEDSEVIEESEKELEVIEESGNEEPEVESEVVINKKNKVVILKTKKK